MRYTSDIFSSTLEVKHSKFIAFLVPYTKYKQQLQTLKENHPKARHFVVAYRYLNEYNQIVEHSSDDGEPKGTSGKPSLFVLQGADIINSAVIIVRYFGGIKLGTGGLVRAYSDAVNLVLDSANLIQYIKEVEEVIEFEYSKIRVVDYEASVYGVTITEKIFDTKATYNIKATQKDMDAFLQKMQRVVRVSR
jgi:uncharacterized YigZ family protein